MNNRRRSDNDEDNYDMNIDDDIDLMRRHSDNTTIINMNSGQPIGLDMNKFMNNVLSDQTVHSISTSNDLPLIAEVNNHQLIIDKRTASKFQRNSE